MFELLWLVTAEAVCVGVGAVVVHRSACVGAFGQVVVPAVVSVGCNTLSVSKQSLLEQSYVSERLVMEESSVSYRSTVLEQLSVCERSVLEHSSVSKQPVLQQSSECKRLVLDESSVS